MLEFPRWKYVLILIVVLASALYALPNLYPQDPSVQITANRGFAIDDALRARIDTALKQAGVQPKQIEVDDGTLLVRLPGLDEQTKAMIRPAILKVERAIKQKNSRAEKSIWVTVFYSSFFNVASRTNCLSFYLVSKEEPFLHSKPDS